ncbi:MAG: hypothetical protein Q9M13_05110 [Mariprofundales bacterium]|nr:hypothetical protein [Mariprofundales bacterium]
MSDTPSKRWKPNIRDAVFLAVVLSVVVTLSLGSSERTTKAVPNDDTHNRVTSHAECMACHGVDGVKPQPLGHTSGVQCFQCHKQPTGWTGGAQ